MSHITYVPCAYTATTSDTTGTGGLSTGGKIGVGIGVPAGGILTVILSVLGVCTCKRCNSDPKDQSEETPLTGQEESQEKSWKVQLDNGNWLPTSDVLSGYTLLLVSGYKQLYFASSVRI